MTSRNSSAATPATPAIPGNGPSWAVLDLGSTRAGGKDDGSLHKLPQMMLLLGSVLCGVGFAPNLRSDPRRDFVKRSILDPPQAKHVFREIC